MFAPEIFYPYLWNEQYVAVRTSPVPTRSITGRGAGWASRSGRCLGTIASWSRPNGTRRHRCWRSRAPSLSCLAPPTPSSWSSLFPANRRRRTVRGAVEVLNAIGARPEACAAMSVESFARRWSTPTRSTSPSFRRGTQTSSFWRSASQCHGCIPLARNAAAVRSPAMAAAHGMPAAAGNREELARRLGSFRAEPAAEQPSHPTVAQSHRATYVGNGRTFTSFDHLGRESPDVRLGYELDPRSGPLRKLRRPLHALSRADAAPRVGCVRHRRKRGTFYPSDGQVGWTERPRCGVRGRA